jgi:hypothetical protein
MAINYPTSLDSFTNPSASSLLTSPSHAQQHSDINDAMEAVQTKLAIGNTVIGTYTAYTPLTFTNVTVGNGTRVAYFCRVNNFVHFFGNFTLGSTSAITGNIIINLPVSMDAATAATGLSVGLTYSWDVSTGILHPGDMFTAGATGSVNASLWNAAGTFVSRTGISSGNPFTWTTGDKFFFNLYYKAA